MPDPAEITVETEPIEDVNITVDPDDVAAIVDPGQLEGVVKPKIDPRTTEPDADHPRFHKINARMKDAEAKVDALEKEKGGTSALIGEMQKHNKLLADAIKNNTDATKVMSGAISDDKTSSDRRAVDDKITTLESQKKDARDSDDWDSYDNLSKEIYNLNQEAKTLETKTEVTPSPPSTTPTENPYQEAAEEFMASTDWYYKDSVMTGAAVATERKLLKDPEWMNKEYKEILTEVKRQIEDKFNYGKLNDPTPPNTPTPSINAVESGNRTGGGSDTGRVVKLTSDELKIAAGFGQTPEEFAEQKLLIKGD